MAIRFLGFVILPLVVLSVWLYSYFKGALPLSEQRLEAQALSAPITLRRDEHGYLTIEANTDNDAFFAIGYAHAQDRLWQLEVQRRTIRGQLSEVMGKEALPFDILVRTLGLHDTAQQSLATLDNMALQSLEHYAMGINYWLEQGVELPAEFKLLDVAPQPWTPADSLAWIKFFALNSASNYRKELDNLLVREVLDSQQQELFLGAQRQSESLDLASQLSAFATNIEQQWMFNNDFVGSNAWVVAKRHMAEGLTTLASDPHLGLQIPSPWYMVSVKGERLAVSGATLVGLPIVMLGRNQHIAWAATNMMADTQDLYFEQINPNNPKEYRFQGEWLKFEERLETFHVKADFPSSMREQYEPVKVRVRQTFNGPIISDVINRGDRPMSLRWTGANTNDRSYEAFYRLNYAWNWQEFVGALDVLSAPAMNMLYMDVDDNIGYLGAGDIPVRGKGQGQYPMPGWEVEAQWQGMIPKSLMPKEFNPERGFIVSANNNMLPDDYAYFVSDDWAPPARAQRITQLIESKVSTKQRLTLEDHLSFQQDVMDLEALKLLPHLLFPTMANDEFSEVMDYLREWNGFADINSIAASIYFMWLPNIKKQVFEDELRAFWLQRNLGDGIDALLGSISNDKLLLALSDPDEAWCDDVSTLVRENCEDVKRTSLAKTIRELRKYFGKDLNNWHWGELQSAYFKHTPLSQVKGLNKVFERRTPRGGSPNSVNAADGQFDLNEGFLATFGTSLRQVIQFDNSQARHLYINTTGQSGNAASSSFDDAIQLFNKGCYIITPDSTGATTSLIHKKGECQ
ncbi:penicillin acylase family protein [Rheinheimera baltica]|uniref:Penicillin acylase family protein n=1 Tax=Rheinheimera baltica TaxID=67576 RepID=A0ABT9HUF7_9GAMM|nr:penicillin acylase family protein [Rheinheimera baltica]MDP5134751.1 penicillin acylase family protein [Rheinheimera baltica]